MTAADLRNGTIPPFPTPEEVAGAAGLRYVGDDAPGYTRVGRGTGFSYHDRDGDLIGGEERERIEALVIPPAWEDVWIAPWKNAHLQATGRDEAGRKQYIYHEKWQDARDRVKYSRVVSFADALPDIRERIDADLRKKSLSRERVLALVIRVLDATGIRVGNEQYAEKNGTYGATTLRKKHVATNGSRLLLEFTGKSGVEQQITIDDERIVRAVRRLEEIPGYRLFKYLDDEGRRQEVESDDVNAWIEETTGASYTAKDFRTWRGTVIASTELCAIFEKEDRSHEERATIINDVIDRVAEELGNTPTVCREHYIHPSVLAAFADGDPTTLINAGRSRTKRLKEWLSDEELRLLTFLRECG